METTKKCKPSDWMKTQINNSFSDALGCSMDVTEEEQDELLYDEDVEITHKYNNNSYHLNDGICTEDISGILNRTCSEDNKYTTANYAAHPQPEEFSSHHRSTKGTMGVSTAMPGSEASFKKEFLVGSSSKPDSKEHLTTSKMSDVLLRHFSEGELLSTCQLIECETIPESSFTDSINDTGSEPEPSEHLRGPSVQEQWATTFEEYHLEKHKEVNSGGKNENVLSENRLVSKKPCTGKCGCRQENSQLINENEHTHTFQNMKDERGLFKKTVSPCKLHYGQGQAHYCLPDFYEVASEVPKRTDNINSVPTTGRAKPFPVLLSKPVTVNNMLENKNYFNSAEVENKEEMSISELLQQLKILPQSDFPNASTAISSGDTGTAPGVITLDAPIPVQSTHGLLKARLQSGTSALPAAGMVEARCPNPSNSLPEPTLGEKMSQILKDQTDQLTKKVEDFSKHMSQETFFLQDKYLALNQLKRYLDALERNYLTAREKHHNLQLQNFKDKSINIGEFDPERRVEGGIFRLGLLLEDIQEQMDHSKHSLSSLLTSYESAYSSHSFCESSVVSSIADPPERRGTETPFLYENYEGEKSPTTDVIPQTNQPYLEGKNCCLCPHININIQERKTGTSSLFSQRKPTDLSDTNLSSDSEDISVYDSYNDSQSKDLVNCDTQNYKSLNTRLCGERKGLGCRCPRGSRDQVKLRNYKESVQSCALCRNKSSGSSSYSQKRISTKKAQKNKQPRELVNRLSERESFEAAKTCCSSTCNKILVSHQYITSKKFAQSKSAIRNASDSNANILSSTLDHAIQTANSLKEATERMVRAVSEDLAKVKRKPL
ncbi:protein AKNAD1 isoform X2 [Neopelma chrysocephalum]|uniref:protein AKNAD1 isoform X2 n=1 Tax=Neopelma chrysocephalum TaxID=114329 RepID=UPI000FCD4406|nr:protein AKNAD1 isoform X2 [Neopelma chrysocephalum]